MDNKKKFFIYININVYFLKKYQIYQIYKIY